MKNEDLAKMESNDMMMVQWMCNVTLKDKKCSSELRDRPGLIRIRNCIQWCRLRWFGHGERKDKDNCVKKSRESVVEGHREKGRPRKDRDYTRRY